MQKKELQFPKLSSGSGNAVGYERLFKGVEFGVSCEEDVPPEELLVVCSSLESSFVELLF